MAVAEKTTVEIAQRNPHHQLVVSSVLGALYLFFGMALVFAGLPALWDALFSGEQALIIELNRFLSSAMLLVVTVPTVVGLIVLGRQLLGEHPPPGLRAGAVLGSVGILLIFLLTIGIGNWMADTQLGPIIEMVITLVIAAALLYGLLWLFLKPGFGGWLARLEENGWFHATSFKGNQGVRVRRGTVIALVVLIVCGVYSMIQHGTIREGRWTLNIPFTGEPGRQAATGAQLTLLYHTSITVPLILVVVAGWIAWRIVNWPAFADFLIATEAELNKVSWTARKRLYQDTIVVLVACILMTIFLFAVDVLWIKILSNPVFPVLDVNPLEIKSKQNAPTQW